MGNSPAIEPARRHRSRKGGKAPIPESLLATLWQKRAARQAWFRTSGGARLRVVYPGRPGVAAGPDFRNALLEVEGVGLVQGDVEIHLHQRDWDSHGHGKDPNYNGVVLHAALEVDSPTTGLQSGRQAPVVSLASLLHGGDPPEDRSAPILWTLLERRGYPRPGTLDGLGALLDRAGDDRFLGKSACFQKYLKEQGPDQTLPNQTLPNQTLPTQTLPNQTLYEGLLEGLGYLHNQQPFVKLAARAPYSALERGARPLPREHRAQAIESWLMGLSGLPHWTAVPEAAPLRAGFGAPLFAGEWHCFRVRPSNHPRHRISGAARLLARYLEEGLVVALRRLVAAGKPQALTSAPAVGGDFDGEKAWIGRGRARDLAVNVVLPFFHAVAETAAGERCTGAPSRGACLALYHRFGKLQENELTREMAGRLVDPAWRGAANTARRQQGLLHLQSLLSGAR